MGMVALNPFHLEYVQYRALWYWWLQIALGVGTAALVSTFVAPVTAGEAAELLRGSALPPALRSKPYLGAMLRAACRPAFHSLLTLAARLQARR